MPFFDFDLSAIRKSGAVHHFGILRGVLAGSAVGLAFPTVYNLARPQLNQLAGLYHEFVQWPHDTWLFLAVIAVSGLFLFGKTVTTYCGKVRNSLQVRPSGGLFWLWLPFSLWTVELFSNSYYRCAFLPLAASLCLSFALLIWVSKLKLPNVQIEFDRDLPIETWEEDILGRRGLVSRLVEELASGCSSVVALVGPYGDGKTSVLNLLKKTIKLEHQDFVVVAFVSSLATSKEILVGTLFNSIRKEVQKRFAHGFSSGRLTAYARSLVGAVPKYGSLLKELFHDPSQEDQIRQLKESLEELNARVVVVIDDMDRMHAEELDVLLKLMRGATEFSNVTYMCAFDKEALVRLVSAQFGDMDDVRRYLEKFFPVQMPLPKIDVDILARLFDRSFEALCKKYSLLPSEEEQNRFNEKFGPLWQLHLNHRFTNLRRIKLFFNRLNASIGAIAVEINLMDFILLEIIRDAAPEIYDAIYTGRRYFFYGRWRVETWMESLDLDQNQAEAMRKQFLDALLQPLETGKKELVTALLCELFPVVQAYRGDPLGGGAEPRDGQSNRRIYHPAFFARYFIFGVQAGQFGEAEFKEFADELNGITQLDFCKGRIISQFKTLPKDSRRRWSFLDLIPAKIGLFGNVQAEALGIATAELSDQLEPPILGLGEAEAEAARLIIFTVASRFAHSSKVQDFLERAIHASTADYFAALVLSACENTEKNQVLTEWEHVNVDLLRSAFRKRLEKKYFPGGTSSIFDPANQRGAIRSLQIWIRLGGTEEMRSYLRGEFGKRALSLGIFISFLFPMEQNANVETLEAVSKLFPLRELEELLEKHGPLAYSSPEQESAIARFTRVLASARLPKLKFTMAENARWGGT
jgi:hypothetical protein